MVEGLLAGGTPAELAALGRGKLKRPSEVLEAAMDGDLSPRHRLVLDHASNKLPAGAHAARWSSRLARASCAAPSDSRPSTIYVWAVASPSIAADGIAKIIMRLPPALVCGPKCYSSAPNSMALAKAGKETYGSLSPS
jgi:hypothetical protein